MSRNQNGEKGQISKRSGGNWRGKWAETEGGAGEIREPLGAGVQTPGVERCAQQQALDAERARMARNLHDELGANLTRIKVLGERIEKDAGDPDKSVTHARLIRQTCHQLADDMDEIVWAVDPRKDRLENLGSYLVNYASEFLGLADVRCRLDVPSFLPDLPLHPQTRHSLFLAAKEALNNVVKHAAATEVQLRLVVKNGVLELEINDNGAGFATGQTANRGNGLGNMFTRLAEIGGNCVIHSVPGLGTTVALSVQI